MERSKLDPRERKAEITALYERADNGQAFRAALEDAGYVLARGDRRALVVVDIAGEVHSLSRQISTARAADIRAQIADLDPASLPGVAEARELQEQRREAQRSARGRSEMEEGRAGGHDAPEAPQRAPEGAEQTSERPPVLAPDDPVLAEARAELERNHEQRRARFEKEWADRIEREMGLVTRQIQERRDIERRMDWKEMEPGKGYDRFEHKLRDRLNPKRISDRYDERQRREAERDVRDTARREVRMAELVADRERARDRMERMFDQEHTRLEETHRRDQDRARSQELDRAREPQSPEIKPPDRGGGLDR